MKELNTSGSDLYPFLSYDEKTLFYTSSDSLAGKETNIYKIKFRPLFKKYIKLVNDP